MFALFVAPVLALAAVEADGSIAAGAAAAAQAQPKPGDEIIVTGERPREKRVCTSDNQTGSLFAKRICRTVAQAEEQRAQSVKFMEEAGRIQLLQSTNERNNIPR